MGIEILTFIGLAVVVEGVAMALFPDALRRAMAQVATLAPERLRRLGLAAAVGGAAFLLVLAHVAGDGTGDGGLGFAAVRAALAGFP